MCCASSEQFVFAIEYENQAGSPETMPFFTQHHIPLSLLVLISEPCWCSPFGGPAGCEAPGAAGSAASPSPGCRTPAPASASTAALGHRSSRSWAHPSWPLERMGAWGSRQALGEPGKTNQCFMSHAHRCLCLSGKLCQARELLMLLPSSQILFPSQPVFLVT